MTIDFLDESVTIALELSRQSDADMMFIEARLRAVATQARRDTLGKVGRVIQGLINDAIHYDDCEAESFRKAVKEIRALKEEL